MMHKLLLLASFLSLGAYGAFELWHRFVTCAPHVQADLLSPDGARLCTTERGGVVRAWDTRSGTETTTPQRPSG